jgi:hypothetical protein
MNEASTEPTAEISYEAPAVAAVTEVSKPLIGTPVGSGTS